MKLYTVSKRMEIAAAHQLDLPYESKCRNLHGHNYIVHVYCKSEELNSEKMVVDFAKIKNLIQEPLDHHYLNDIIEGNPTAENMTDWIMNIVNDFMKTDDIGANNSGICYKVTVQESEGNIATLEIL